MTLALQNSMKNHKCNRLIGQTRNLKKLEPYREINYQYPLPPNPPIQACQHDQKECLRPSPISETGKRRMLTDRAPVYSSSRALKRSATVGMTASLKSKAVV
jgi:hypothetical protein